MPAVRDRKVRRVKPDRRAQRAILVQLVRWDHRDPKDSRVKQDQPDLRDRRAIRVKLVNRDPKARKGPTVRKDLKVFKARLVRPDRLLNRRSALLPVQTAQLRAMKMRFWFRSFARLGRLTVQRVQLEARRQACAYASKPAR